MAILNNRPPASNKAVFITPTGAVDITMVTNDLQSLCSAARTLKARYFVAADGWDDAACCPIWGVFDMKTAQDAGGGPGQWSIRDPIRKFSTPRPDPAVMYAMTVAAGSN